MSAGRGHAQFRAIAFYLIPHTSGLPRLWINQLNIRNIDKGFFVDDSPATIRLRVRALMALDHPHTLDLDFAPGGSNLEDPAPPALIAPGNNYYLIVLLNFRALSCRHTLK